MTKKTPERPPENARRVYGWVDLPADERAETYTLKDRNGREYEIVASGKCRRVLEGLLQTPIFSASYARISQYVAELRNGGADIETKRFKGDAETGRSTFGVYVLHSTLVSKGRKGIAARVTFPAKPRPSPGRPAVSAGRPGCRNRWPAPSRPSITGRRADG